MIAYSTANYYSSCSCMFSTQHASADVEKMILGNKCDINEKRQVSKDRGEKVSTPCSFTKLDVFL